MKKGQTRIVSVHLTPAGRALLALAHGGAAAAHDAHPGAQGSHAGARVDDDDHAFGA